MARLTALSLQGKAVRRQALQHASRNIDRRRIEHGVVIGKGNVLEDHAVVVFVE